MNVDERWLGLYVHIPYCTVKCGYCDFYSIAMEGRPVGGLMDALRRELADRTIRLDRKLDTIFVGGGTPTVLPIEAFTALMADLGKIASKHQPAEFTVEANPGTVDADRLALLHDAGVTRLSMGAQSFHPDELVWLQRDHSPDHIGPSVSRAREAGIENINLDLIFGIGCQTMASWNASLDRAIELGVDHISCYALMYEPGTPMTAMLERGELQRCDEDLEAAMFLAAVDRLAEAGYEQYEISNYARPSRRCLHNLVYWRGGSYIGVGPSATGTLKGRRYKNFPHITRYIESMSLHGRAEESTEPIVPANAVRETTMLQLRTTEGIDRARFASITGTDPWPSWADTAVRLASTGLLESTDTHLRLTRQGMLVADSVIVELWKAIETGALCTPGADCELNVLMES